MDNWLGDDWFEIKVTGPGIEDYPVDEKEDVKPIIFSISKDKTFEEYTKLLIKRLCKDINQIFNKKIAFEEWYEKDREFPYITYNCWGIPSDSDIFKSVFVDISIWSEKQSMQEIVNKTYWFLKTLNPSNEIKGIRILSTHTLPVKREIAKLGIDRVVIETKFKVNLK